MKQPIQAPTIEELRSKLGGEPELYRILSRVPAPLVDGRYLHYADLMHRQPPSGLSLDEWWLGLRLRRQLSAVQLPLVDKSGGQIAFALTESVQEHLHWIDLQAGGQIGMRDQITNPDTRNQYCVRSLIEEAITSSQIEGAVTTRKAAKDMLRKNRRPVDISERMILNNYSTMAKIREWKDEDLSKELVFEMQRLLTAETLDDPTAAGRFRRDEEDIVVGPAGTGEILHTPPGARQLDERLAALCRFANGEDDGPFVHPVVRAVALHFMMGYDHPFVDGNGRTARALFYWSMLKSGYWLMEFISISSVINKARKQYERAYLFTERDSADMTYFLIHQLDVIRKAVAALHDYIDRRTRELGELQRTIAETGQLNHRQRALLAHALRHAGHAYSFYGHAGSHGVTHQTARSDLLDLEQRGWLTKHKIGRSWEFVPVAGFERRLQGDGSSARAAVTPPGTRGS